MKDMNITQYTHRYLSRFIIEAITPLTIGSGENSILTDALVVLDFNGLPYIPGSSLTGVIRHFVGEEKVKEIFGYQTPNKSTKGHGSEVIISDAKMIGKDGKVIDGLENIDFSDSFYNHFLELPIRQHVRISHKGVAHKGGKFDEQIIFKGTRFCFEIEFLYNGNENKLKTFKSILASVNSNSFRIGGGSHSGFGEINVISFCEADLNLSDSEDLKLYLNKSSSLSDTMWWIGKEKNIKSLINNEETEVQLQKNNIYDEYKLILKPNDFFLFGSGMGDADADITPVKATYIRWDDSHQSLPNFKSDAILIPGTSVKGALAHRIAFYHNMLEGKYADKEEYIENLTGNNNEAVKALFGYTKEGKTIQVPGNVMISDLIINHNHTDKLLNHVAIDRFTGGAIDGALFTEKTIYDQENSDEKYEIKLLVKQKDYPLNTITALKRALLDICNGMLPLGGGVNRGNGCFKGDLFINGKIESNGNN